MVNLRNQPNAVIQPLITNIVTVAVTMGKFDGKQKAGYGANGPWMLLEYETQAGMRLAWVIIWSE